MRKKIILIAGLQMVAASIILAQVKTVLTGKIEKAPVSSVLYLNYLNDGVSEQDSTVLKQDGKFSFKAATSKAVIARLFISHPASPGLKKNSDKVFFYLEGGKVKFAPSDSLRTAAIHGRGLNTDYSSLKAQLLPLEKQREALFSTLTEENRKSESFILAYRDQNEAIASKQQDVYRSFVQSHPNSLVSFYALDRIGGPFPDFDELNALFSSLSAELISGEEGLAWSKKLTLLKNTSIGSMAPIFTSTTPSGSSISLKDLRGKYVLLDFWASWCGPCRQESPHLIKAYKTFGSKGFTIFNISLDSKNAKDAWLKAIEDDKIGHWNHASDLDGFKSTSAELYGIQAIPQNFLIDPTGKIVAKNLRGEFLEKELSEILGK